MNTQVTSLMRNGLRLLAIAALSVTFAACDSGRAHQTYPQAGPLNWTVPKMANPIQLPGGQAAVVPQQAANMVGHDMSAMQMPGTQQNQAASAVQAATPAAPALNDMHRGGPVGMTPNVVYTLKTGIAEGRLVFIGVGGKIDGVVDPKLQAQQGDTVQITLTNGDGTEHDMTIPELNVQSDKVRAVGASSAIVLKADKTGDFVYFCSLPGHRQAGMEGHLVIGQDTSVPAPAASSITHNPTDLPTPLGNRAPQNVRVDLETSEMEGQLADGVTYTYWTFNNKVPGPFVRVMEGDTVEVHLKNRAESHMTHSVDFHAVTGPGGGASLMQVPPGQEKVFTFKAQNPGLFVYHCATPMVANHISSGMYGLILVEPKGGLPKVDREFYVMQGDLYTHGAYMQRGHQEFDADKLLAERPEYLVLNGSVGSLTKEFPLKANVGETVRIFFGVGGPNVTSSFHVIGEVFDRVYSEASLTAAPLTNVQTTQVPAGGATMVEFKLDVPGRYVLVDHSLARMERGLVGFLEVSGAANPAIFHEGALQ